MAHQMPRYHNGNMGPQARWGNQHNQQARFHPPPVHFLQGEIQRLSALLEMERARWFEENQKVACLEAELEETKFQWRRQKHLKEMYINKGKETKRELERIEKFSDPATLNPAVIASKVHDNMKYKKKKLLQKDFVQLKVAHTLDQEAFTSQIQAENEKNNALQEELDKLKTSYEELRSKCEADVAAGRQQAQMQKFCEERIGEDPQLLENLRVEKDDLYQKMSQEIAFLQEREKGLQRELDQIKVSHQELNCKYEKDVSALKQQAETYKQEISCEKNVNLERANKDLQLINNLRAEKEDLYQKMSQEITLLQEREKQSKSELVQVKVLYQELNCKYEKDVSALKQQAETCQQEIIHQTKAKSEQDLKLINELRAEKEDLHQKMLQEITFQQQKSTETAKHLQCQLEQVKVSYQELKATYEIDVLALRQQAETFELELEKEVKTNLQAGSNNLQLLKELEAEKDTFCQQLTVLQQLYSDREINYETELQNLKSEIQSLTALNEKLSAGLKDRNDFESPKRKVPNSLSIAKAPAVPPRGHTQKLRTLKSQAKLQGISKQQWAPETRCNNAMAPVNHCSSYGQIASLTLPLPC
ncbi:hypothetical protein CRENBAI_026112 [Crenichthys baileyi]|uniref:Uncharacterized protein n=1 Tax=Crenichthys baileyi TaxID=28760 RepID=A0AAV9S8U9_9TELE